MPTIRGQSRRVNQAFILGAGLGTRLRPLTHRLPKPLVPLFHRPLAEWAMEACEKAGIRRFAINTHHLPEAWNQFGDAPVSAPPPIIGANGELADFRSWKGHEVALFQEPVLLETGGGLKNIAAWIGADPLLIHNGDIFTTLPLSLLIAAHESSGLPVTLALRSEGEARHIAFDPAANRVTDIRRMLDRADGSHVFSGIYCVNPGFLGHLPVGEKVSVIPAFLDLARQGKLGAVVLDEGVWLDLGDRESYLQAHHELGLGAAIHPLAGVESGAIVENSVIGPRAVIQAGAIVRNSVVWPDSKVSSSAVLDQCIVCSANPVAGAHHNEDF